MSWSKKSIVLKTRTYIAALLPYSLPASCSCGLPEPQPTLYPSFNDKGSLGGGSYFSFSEENFLQEKEKCWVGIRSEVIIILNSGQET